jgi:CheY-like chemotaxis protein
VNRILLMAPDARGRRALSRALAIEGYSVCAAQDSGEAVRGFLIP